MRNEKRFTLYRTSLVRSFMQLSVIIVELIVISSLSQLFYYVHRTYAYTYIYLVQISK